MTLSRAGSGQLRVIAESAMGVPTGSYWNTRPEALPNFPASKQLIDNHIAGHAHALKREKPEVAQNMVESAFSADFRIRRAVAGAKPDIIRFFESAGWEVASTDGDTTLTGTPTVSSLIQNETVVEYPFQFVLVERSAGVHVPVLVNNLTGDGFKTMVPHVRLSAAPTTGAAVTTMYSVTPTTDTTFSLANGKTLGFRLNTYGQYDAALQDLALGLRACALAQVGEMVIGKAGTFPVLNCTFHGVPVDITADAMGNDSFNDTSRFAVINDDLEFAMVASNGTGDIALVTKAITEARINFGVNTVPQYANGAGSVGGAIGFMNMMSSPRITIVAQYRNDDASKAWFTNLETTNPSLCIQIVQPTRNLAQPAFGIAMPNCHIVSGGEPVFGVTGDVLTATMTLEADISGVATGTMITDTESAPIIFGISGQAS